MDTASMLEEYRRENPRRKIIFLNAKNDRYFEEYARFNLDILSEGLARGGVCFSVVDDGVFISGEDAQRRLLFECGILCASHDGGAILKPYANACDIMSAICRISEIFGNRY
ncbi:MAG: hypothetical protein E7622_02580 [Ruminococcaceae bacterium]|nr:hypothetical protein [Oscillospiraceae bacterium]